MPKLRRKPPLYENPNELLEYFYAYIDDCIDEQRLPNLAGYTVHCFGSITNRIRYEQKEEYCSTFELIRLMLEDETLNNKSIDSQIKKLVLQSKYDYTDKVTSENVNVNDNLDNLSKEERQSRINELLQKMNKDK